MAYSSTGEIEIKCFCVLKAGEKMTPWTYSIPAELGPDDVDIEISHCGVCHSDIHQIDNAWGVAAFPLVPGHEIVGTVVKVGSNVSSFAVGDTAGIGVQRSNCGQCEFCRSGRDHICPKITKTYAGPGKDKGGFSHYIRYPAKWVFQIPSSYSRAHAAPMLCAGITTYSPLKKYVPKEGPPAVVGIIGVGGLGHIGIQIAAAMVREKKGKVVAVSTSIKKKDECTKLGATDFLVSKDADQMAKWTGKFDCLLNTVSGVYDLDGYLALLKPNGVMACVGLPEKDQKCGVFMQAFVPTEKAICGSYLGPRADYEEMFRFCEKNNIKPMIEEFEATQINEAIEKVRNNDMRYRAVVKMPGADNAEKEANKSSLAKSFRGVRKWFGKAPRLFLSHPGVFLLAPWIGFGMLKKK